MSCKIKSTYLLSFESAFHATDDLGSWVGLTGLGVILGEHQAVVRQSAAFYCVVIHHGSHAVVIHVPWGVFSCQLQLLGQVEKDIINSLHASHLLS